MNFIDQPIVQVVGIAAVVTLLVFAVIGVRSQVKNPWGRFGVGLLAWVFPIVGIVYAVIGIGSVAKRKAPKKAASAPTDEDFPQVNPFTLK